MEIPPLSTSAVNVQSSRVSGCISTDECKPGDEVIVDKDTYILGDDGVIIPVPAGTVALLLPDSDDEDSASSAGNQLLTDTHVNACVISNRTCVSETNTINQCDESSYTLTSSCISETATANDGELFLTNQVTTETKPEHLRDLETAVYSAVSVEPDCISVSPHAEDSVIGACDLDASENPNSSLPLSDLYFQEEEEVVEESVALLTDVDDNISFETETDTYQHPIVKSVRKPHNRKPAKTVKRLADKGLLEEYDMLDIDSSVNRSVIDSSESITAPKVDESLTKPVRKLSRTKPTKTAHLDLGPKEIVLEENLIMDGTVKTSVHSEISSTTEVKSSQLSNTGDVPEVTGCEDTAESLTQKPELPTKMESQDGFGLQTADESKSQKSSESTTNNSSSRLNEITLEKQRSADVHSTVTVQPAVSASGRPQRSTPRRSAYELLHGLVHRSTGEHDSDQTSAKKSKGTVSKKNTDVGLLQSDDSLPPEGSLNAGKSRIKKGGTLQSDVVSECDLVPSSDENPVTGMEVVDAVVHQQNKGKRKMQSADVESQGSFHARKQEMNHLEHVNKLPPVDNVETSASSDLQQAGDGHSSSKRVKLSSDQVSQDSEDSGTPRRGRPKKGITKAASKTITNSGSKSLNESQTVANNAELIVTGSHAVPLTDDTLSHKRNQRVGNIEASGKKTAQLDCYWQSDELELPGDVGSGNLPGFPYHSFTSDHQADEIKPGLKSSKNRQGKIKSDKPLSRYDSSLADIEKMQARIRELEADVSSLKERLDEAKVKGAANCTQELKELSLSVEEATDKKTSLERWEKKLRAIDHELEERATALVIRQGQIVRHEQRLMEKERRLRQMERDLALRKRQASAALEENASTASTKTARKLPSMLTERANLEAEEQRLELKRRELDNEKSFLEDEKKKLVEKELELESREQAAVDADLFSFAHGFSASVGNAAGVVPTEKQSNGKLVVHFSDDDDDEDGFGADVSSSNSTVPMLKHTSFAALESEEDDTPSVKTATKGKSS